MQRGIRFDGKDREREMQEALASYKRTARVSRPRISRQGTSAQRSAAANFMKNYNNVSRTENGAVGKKTTTHPLLDLNFKVSSLRNRSEEYIVEEFIKAYYDDRRHAMKWLFFVRDILEGLGERRTFRACLKYMAESHPEETRAVMGLIPEYGRYDDLLVLVDTALCEDVCAMLREQLEKDMVACANGNAISLLAKWMPSCNTSSVESRRLARAIRAQLGMSERAYRKMLSKLRGYSNVVEVKISANQWDQVDYEKVPAKANLKYADAFEKHDLEGRSAYILKVITGDAKLNSAGLAPHEIARRVINREESLWSWKETFKSDLMAELLWDKIVEEGFQNDWGFEDCIVVADGSGSMYSEVAGDSNTLAIDVCNSLAVYFAQQLQGVFHDKAITFSENPQFLDLSSGDGLKEKLEIMYAYNEIANTNIEAVFDMLLDMAVSNQVPEDQIPKQVLIISDMEFDMATGRRYAFSEDLFEQIAQKYQAAGYQIPRLIFWNVCGRSDTIPAVEGEQGICLLSGYAVNAMKVATHRESKDPYEALLKTLDAPRYDAIDIALDTLVS